MQVPKGHVWLEGDNALNSTDSRTFGSVPAGLIRGRAVCRLWPLSDVGRLDSIQKWQMERWWPTLLRSLLGPTLPPCPPCPTCHHHHHTWWETPILGMPSVVCQHQFICSWSVPYFITFWCWKGIYTDFRGVLVRSSLPFQMELSLFSFSCTRYPESSFLNFLYLIILSFHVFNSLSFISQERLPWRKSLHRSFYFIRNNCVGEKSRGTGNNCSWHYLFTLWVKNMIAL